MNYHLKADLRMEFKV